MDEHFLKYIRVSFTETFSNSSSVLARKILEIIFTPGHLMSMSPPQIGI